LFYQYQPNFTLEEVLEYLRKSQSDDSTLSVEEVLANHERILDEWTERHLGGKVSEAQKFREVVSGETMKERPGILQVLKMIESPKIKAVLVVEPQRLTRGDGEEIGRLMKLFKFTNTLVATPHRTYDLRDDYDWDALERELKRGNDYLQYTKKILNRGLLLSVSQGNYVGNVPPYGYDKDMVMDGKRKCPTLKINPEQANVIRMMFDWYVNKDMGRHVICRKLDELGIKPPRGKHWSPYTMLDMLSNVHYIGKVRWNWRKTVHRVEDGEILKSRPKTRIGEYLIYEGKHPAIISEELFNAAQEKKGRNHRAKPKTKIRNPLASILYCQCGRAMSLRTYTAHKGEPRLLCDGQVYCKTGSCTFDEMIDRVEAILKECIQDFEVRLTNDEGDSAKLHANLIQSLEKKEKELAAKELAQWEAQSSPNPDERMPVHIFKQLNEKLLAEKEEVKNALCKAYESMPEAVDYGEKIRRFTDALDALRNPDIDAQTKNILLKSCIDKIIYKREKPERVKSTAKRVTVNGRRIKPDGIPPSGRWTSPPIELDVKLRV
jgi:hypothetical protein